MSFFGFSLIFHRFEIGLELVWNWFGIGWLLVWNWFAVGLELVFFLFGIEDQPRTPANSQLNFPTFRESIPPPFRTRSPSPGPRAGMFFKCEGHKRTINSKKYIQFFLILIYHQYKNEEVYKKQKSV